MGVYLNFGIGNVQNHFEPHSEAPRCVIKRLEMYFNEFSKGQYRLKNASLASKVGRQIL